MTELYMMFDTTRQVAVDTAGQATQKTTDSTGHLQGFLKMKENAWQSGESDEALIGLQMNDRNVDSNAQIGHRYSQAMHNVTDTGIETQSQILGAVRALQG